jgi:penicillin-binding protein 1A
MTRQSAPQPASNRKKRSRPVLWFLLKWGLVGGIWASFLLLIIVAWCAYDLPDVSGLNDIKRRPSVTLLATDGSILASYGDLYGAKVTLQDMPPYLPEAVLATEDRRFYSHFGVDPLGLLRAVYINLKSGELVQGGSTITQQLAKNVFLTPERSLHRKGQEVLLALWLEHHFTKQQILELYLNRVYFGAGTFGVDAASRKYFGHPVKDISIFESAMLAGMLKAPSKYNPFNDKGLATGRATQVVKNMVAAGYLSEAEATAVVQQTAPAVAPQAAGQIGQYFADWVIDQVSSYVGASTQDLVVQTTLDPRMQRAAESNLGRVLQEKGADMKASQAALVAMTPDGAVRALVGGTSYHDTQFNRATQALRQPGSSFKAFVFLTAFENGYTPEDHFVDGPISIGNWSPGNYEDKFYGDISLREAFARSLNSVAVQLSERVGRRHVIETAQRLGITSPLDNNASIALGTSGASLLEMTGAYATFANQGNGVWPRGIEQITTRDGQILYQRSGDGPGRVASSGAINKMLDVMQAVVDWGTGKRAKIDRPAYGKTGTSQNYRDAWFVGLTGNLVAGIWVGNDDNSPMQKVTGGALPVLIWHDFMSEALAGTPPVDVTRPSGGGFNPATTVSATPDTPETPAQPVNPPQTIGGLIENIFQGSGGSDTEADKKRRQEQLQQHVGGGKN